MDRLHIMGLPGKEPQRVPATNAHSYQTKKNDIYIYIPFEPRSTVGK